MIFEDRKFADIGTAPTLSLFPTLGGLVMNEGLASLQGTR